MIITYEIHPAIGIARAGSSHANSDQGYFIGPELGYLPPANYRDPNGYLKRQAARLRVFPYGGDDQGKLLEVVELTLADMRTISWTAHLVNRKGTARRCYHSGPGFRNHAANNEVTDRELIIDP